MAHGIRCTITYHHRWTQTEREYSGLPTDIKKGLLDKLTAAQQKIAQKKYTHARNILNSFIIQMDREWGRALTPIGWWADCYCTADYQLNFWEVTNSFFLNNFGYFVLSLFISSSLRVVWMDTRQYYLPTSLEREPLLNHLKREDMKLLNKGCRYPLLV